MEKTELDKKINDVFPGLVVRKDLVKSIRSNAPVPGYVLEYLLGMYCATDDEATIADGIEQVREILRVHYVNRNEAELIKSKIKEKGHHKIIDCVSVELNAQGGIYEMAFQNLGIKKIPVDVQTVKNNKKLLVGGVWCMIDVQYDIVEEKGVSPWSIRSLKAIQMSGFDKEPPGMGWMWPFITIRPASWIRTSPTNWTSTMSNSLSSRTAGWNRFRPSR